MLAGCAPEQLAIGGDSYIPRALMGRGRLTLCKLGMSSSSPRACSSPFISGRNTPTTRMKGIRKSGEHSSRTRSCVVPIRYRVPRQWPARKRDTTTQNRHSRLLHCSNTDSVVAYVRYMFSYALKISWHLLCTLATKKLSPSSSRYTLVA